MPGFRGAEAVEIKRGELKLPEAKEFERRVQPFLIEARPSERAAVSDSAATSSIRGFVEIGESAEYARADREIPARRPSVQWAEEAPRQFNERNEIVEKEKRDPKVAIAIGAGLTAFLGFMGEAFGGPATEMFLQKKKSPTRVREGMPEGETPVDVSKAKDHQGFGETGMILGLALVLALPFAVGKARRAWHRRQVNKFPERVEKLTERLAASLHKTAAWRASVLEGKTKVGLLDALKGLLLSWGLMKFKPDVRETKDLKWIQEHPEVPIEARGDQLVARIDVANAKYEDLPAEFRAEPRLLAEAAMVEVVEALKGKIEKFDDAFVENAAQAVFAKWQDARLEQYPTEARRGFEQLSEPEKENFYRVVGEAIQVYDKSGWVYPHPK